MDFAKALVPRLYLNQHYVLEKIYNVPSVNSFPNIEDLADALHLSEEDVMQASYSLKERGYAFVQKDKRPFVVGCTPDGAQALLRKSLLEEGKEKAKANLLRWMQITGIIVASSISIGTFIINAITTISNSKKIEVLAKQVEQIQKSRK